MDMTVAETDRSGQQQETEYQGLGDVLGEVEKLGRENSRVSVGDLVEELGRASVAALVFVPALVAATPLSGIPGLSSLCGIVIALVSLQAVLGRRGLWLPGFVMRQNIEGDELVAGLRRVRKITDFLDRHTHERLEFMVRKVGAKLMFAICMVGGMVMPLLEIIPFSASAIAICVAFLSLAVLTIDGLLAIISLSFLAAVGAVLLYFI
jgi:hypothetical protein